MCARACGWRCKNWTESNFALAHQRLFAPAGVPASQVHRLLGEQEPAVAVKAAERELTDLVGCGADGVPVLDLVWLGLGEDGHVASLFPGAPAAVRNSQAAYVAVRGPKPPPQRLTLSYTALAAAREVWVLAAGAGKGAILRATLASEVDTPLAGVLRRRRRTLILTDTGT